MNKQEKNQFISSLIVNNENKVSRLKLFKLAFLLSQKMNEGFEFVPYKFGPYSFEMDSHIREMIKNNLIIEDDSELKIPYESSLKWESANYDSKIKTLLTKFWNLSENEVIDYVYSNYPYYTQNSELLKNKPTKLDQVKEIAIYTIGYQDISIDQFVNILIKKNIKVLLDVRNKPFSYKYGFSKHWLIKYLPTFNIEYINIPQLGIPEHYRNSLTLKQLWIIYKDLLKENKTYLEQAATILKNKPSALMCYEANLQECHRSILSEHINKMENLKIIDFHNSKKEWIERN